MADPLSLLRQFILSEREYEVTDNDIIFGDLVFPKGTKTNFVIFGTGRDGSEKEYYTIGSVIHLLQNVSLNHVHYVKAAAAEKIDPIRRPDRKDLLAYLNGEVITLASIDRSAPLAIALQRNTQVKRNASAIDAVAEMEEGRKIDEETAVRLKERLVQKLENQSKEKYADAIRPLSDKLSKEVIQQLRAKALAKRRNRIVESEGQEAFISQLSSAPADMTKGIMERERVWRNRTTVLQSSGKDFEKNIQAILSSVKAREEGPSRTEDINRRTPAINSLNPVRSQPPVVYSRYDQERFGAREETEEFKIDVHGTYHGMSLKSVTEGIIAKKSQNVTPVPSPVSSDRPRRVSRTPIIIIPAGVVSLITMLNAKDILQDLKYVSNEEKRSQGCHRDAEILLQRKKEDGTTVPYRVIDNIAKLTPEDWSDRVVAVFCQGPSWQFKGWPWGGNPIDIFYQVKAFHLKLAGVMTDVNIAKWNVFVIELDPHKRHLDRARLLTFWDQLDRFVAKNKSHLRF